MPHRLYESTCACCEDQDRITRPICPDCGAWHSFKRWALSVTENMGLYAKKTGLPPLCPLPPDLGPLAEDCEHCDGMGIVDVRGGDTWAHCPECDGRGGFRLLSEEQISFLRPRMVQQGKQSAKEFNRKHGYPIDAAKDSDRRESSSIWSLPLPEGLVDVARLSLEDLVEALREAGHEVEVIDPVYQGDRLVLRCVLRVDNQRQPLQYNARRNRWLTCDDFGVEELPPGEAADGPSHPAEQVTSNRLGHGEPEKEIQTGSGDSGTDDSGTYSEDTDPWANISPECLAEELSRGLKEASSEVPGGRQFVAEHDHSVRAALSAAVEDEEALTDYFGEPWWNVVHPMEVLDSIPEVEARRVVICWVSDSPAGGEWSLNEVRARGRGFVFYVPDFGVGDRDDCPIIAGWEPADNHDLRRMCLVSTYAEQFKDRGYPPFIGQWAKGDPEILREGMQRALEQHPNAWTEVYRWVRRYLGSRVALGESDIEIVAQALDQPRERVAELTEELTDGAVGLNGSPERQEEVATVIGLVVQALAKGPY